MLLFSYIEEVRAIVFLLCGGRGEFFVFFHFCVGALLKLQNNHSLARFLSLSLSAAFFYI